MLIKIELLYNREKETYTVLNLEDGTITSLQRNAGRGLNELFEGLQKSFMSREEINDYIKTIRKQIKDTNVNRTIHT